MYSGYAIAFDGVALWSFGNDSARNVIIFGVDNSSVSHTDNCKNNFWMLGEGLTDKINGSVGATEKKFSINFSKAKTNFCFSLHYNGDNDCMLLSCHLGVSEWIYILYMPECQGTPCLKQVW